MRAMDTVVTIKEFFDAPQVMTSWRLNRKDHNLVRFGLLWRIDDLVLRKGISSVGTYPFRTDQIEPLSGYILGG